MSRYIPQVVINPEQKQTYGALYQTTKLPNHHFTEFICSGKLLSLSLELSL